MQLFNNRIAIVIVGISSLCTSMSCSHVVGQTADDPVPAAGATELRDPAHSDPHEMSIHILIRNGIPAVEWPKSDRIPPGIVDDLKRLNAILATFPIKESLSWTAAPDGRALVVSGRCSDAPKSMNRAWCWKNWRDPSTMHELQIGAFLGGSTFVGNEYFVFGTPNGSLLFSIDDANHQCVVNQPIIDCFAISNNGSWVAAGLKGDLRRGTILGRTMVDDEHPVDVGGTVKSLVLLRGGKFVAASVTPEGKSWITVRDRRGKEIQKIESCTVVYCTDATFTFGNRDCLDGFGQINEQGHVTISAATWHKGIARYASPSGKIVQGFVAHMLVSVKWLDDPTPLMGKTEQLPPMMGGNGWLAW